MNGYREHIKTMSRDELLKELAYNLGYCACGHNERAIMDYRIQCCEEALRFMR